MSIELTSFTFRNITMLKTKDAKTFNYTTSHLISANVEISQILLVIQYMSSLRMPLNCYKISAYASRRFEVKLHNTYHKE